MVFEMNYSFLQDKTPSVTQKLMACMDYVKTTFKMSDVIILCSLVFILAFCLGYWTKKQFEK